MKLFKDFLVEADTSGATNVEMAIVYGYNRNVKKMKHAKALSVGEIAEDKFAKLKPDEIKTGKLVAQQLGNVGSNMVHAGSSSAATQYKFGKDTTSKSDLYGNSKNRFSLKKAGDSGSGAQLMSAKSGEAVGVVNYAMKHLAKNDPNVELEGVDKAMKILKSDMLKTARNDLFVEVAKGKEEFQNWWKSDKNPRYKQIAKIVNKKKIDKEGYIVEAYVKRVAKFKAKSAKPIKASHIQDHLHAELSLLGAAVKTLADAEKKLIKNKKGKSIITPLKRKEVDKLLLKFSSQNAKIGDVKVSDSHLDKAKPGQLKSSALRKQIVDVIKVAIAAKGWKETLSSFFETNEELKKWVVYEAASGLGKFTGTASVKKSYSGDVPSVANTMLVFNNSGVKTKEDIYKWSTSHTNLLDKISISYKGSGTSKYIKLGLRSSVEYNNVSVLSEEVSTTLDNIIDLELIKYEAAMYNLDEGFLDTIKGTFRSAVDATKAIAKKAQELLQRFYEAVIEKFFEKIMEWAKKGLAFMMDILGYEIDGDVSIATPSW
jgi:hypothetical protein